jgi:hypothetical protein
MSDESEQSATASNREPDPDVWYEAIYKGEMRCDAEGCEGVDLEDVDDVNEAIQKWNTHVKMRHDNE